MEKDSAPEGIAEQKNLLDDRKSSTRKYRDMFVGPASFWYFIKYEILTTLLGPLPGALGLFLRKIFYRRLFPRMGRGVVFGRNMTIRHPRKITIGDGVVFDELSVIDAKGRQNRGIRLGNHVFIGRNSVLSCKGGDITIGDYANIGSNNTLLSESKIEIGRYVFTAGHVYMVAGGNHSFDRRDIPIWHQPSQSKGGIVLEDDVWIGAACTIVDGVVIRTGSILGAGSLAHKKIPPYSVALGNPATVIKKRGSR